MCVCFCQFCFPVSSGFLYCETLPSPGVRPVLSPVGKPNPFGSARLPRENKIKQSSACLRALLTECSLVSSLDSLAQVQGWF